MKAQALTIFIALLAAAPAAAQLNTPIMWCEIDANAPPSSCQLGHEWGCDCEGNCAKAVDLSGGFPNPVACGSGPGCPTPPRFRHDRIACTGISCEARGDDCGDLNNSCDSSSCKEGPPSNVMLQIDANNPLTGKLLNVPVCVPKRKCSASMGDSKLPEEVCRPVGFKKNGGPREIGDPVEVDTQQSTHAHVDISIPTVSGQFNFTRMYTSSTEFWKQGDGFGDLSPPFGWNPSDPSTMNWSHSLFSFVRPLVGTTNCAVRVRRGDGSMMEFSGCQTNFPHFMEPDGAALELGLRLKRQSQFYFVLYDGDRQYTYDYMSQPSGSQIMLTSIRDSQVNPARPAIASLTWDENNCNGNSSLAHVLVGGQQELFFQYTDLGSGACALEVIYDNQSNKRAAFLYADEALAAAYGIGFDEAYNYSVGTNTVFEVRSFGALRTTHEYVDGRVSSLHQSWDGVNSFKTDEFVGSDCAALTSCAATRFSYKRFASFRGDGSRTAATPIDYTVAGPYSSTVEGFRAASSTEPGRAGSWSWADTQPGASAPEFVTIGS